LLIGYLQAFWTEGSKYLKAATLTRGEPLGTTYVKLHRDDIRLHVEPFEGFAGITMQDLSPALIQDWQLWLADRNVTLPKRKADDKERTVERTLSGARINKIMQTISVSVNFLLERGELQNDPFKRIKIAKEKAVISAIWEKETKGTGLFMVAVKSKDGLTVAEQMKEKIGML
jgi:hypothetical protein